MIMEWCAFHLIKWHISALEKRTTIYYNIKQPHIHVRIAKQNDNMILLLSDTSHIYAHKYIYVCPHNSIEKSLNKQVPNCKESFWETRQLAK